MPEGAIEAAHRILSRMQLWPPAPPPEHDRMISRMETRTAAGTKAGFSSWDGDTCVVGAHRYVRGHELTTIERICLEGDRLIYKHEITGPGEKHDEREITFDIPQPEQH